MCLTAVMWLFLSSAWRWRSRTCRHNKPHADVAETCDSSLPGCQSELFAPLCLTDPSQTAPAAAAVGNPAPGARRMVAIFDYDPRESSPNTDIEVRHMHISYSRQFSVCVVVVFAHYLPRFFWPGSGWADLQRRRHHTCVWWHGRRRLLLRKCRHSSRIKSGLYIAAFWWWSSTSSLRKDIWLSK